MAPYSNLKKEEKEKLIKTWEIIAKKLEGFNYKPTEITEKQRDFIYELIRFLDRREASTLIELLRILNKRNEKYLEMRNKRKEEFENKSTKLSSYQKKLNKIRRKHSKAYFPWTQEDDLLLKSKVKEGLKTSLIAEIFERKPSSINARIKKLRLRRKVKTTIQKF